MLEARRLAGKKLDSTANELMRQWIRRIGYQPSDFDRLNIVHVAGTKGKGTTCAYVNSILTYCNKSVGRPGKIGLYTSPHLVSVRERIRINSEPISEEQFTKYFFDVCDALESSAERDGFDPTVKPIYFRFLTLLSFHVFMKEGVDTAIYEVGVGGELDSTNIIVKPAVTGITTLGIDHVASLASPAFSVHQVDEAAEVLVKRAEEKDVRLEWVGISPEVRHINLKPAEEFQYKNASLAVALVVELLKRFDVFLRTRRKETTTFRLAAPIVPPESPSEILEKPDTAGNSTKLPGEAVEGLESVVWRASHLPKILIFNQQSSCDALDLVQILHTRVTGMGVRFQYVIFCTNITYKGSRYKLDFVNKNTDPEALKSLSLQKTLQGQWEKLDPDAEVVALPTIEDARERARLALIFNTVVRLSLNTTVTLGNDGLGTDLTSRRYYSFETFEVFANATSMWTE
ncbi:Folylpolyglutamate synthetase [Botryosphaeria dothidea]